LAEENFVLFCVLNYSEFDAESAADQLARSEVKSSDGRLTSLQCSEGGGCQSTSQHETPASTPVSASGSTALLLLIVILITLV